MRGLMVEESLCRDQVVYLWEGLECLAEGLSHQTGNPDKQTVAMTSSPLKTGVFKRLSLASLGVSE